MDETTNPTPASTGTKSVAAGLIIVAIALVLLYLLPKQTSAPTNNNNNNNQQASVTDFQSCAAAGYQILETFPAQCKTPDGRTFTEVTNVPQSDVIVETPEVAQLVASPMTIKAKVRGTWFFEANIPIILKDETGKVLAQKGYMTSDNWMTNDYVNVDTTLSFKSPTTDYGVLEIHNDNPSGDPANDKVFKVQVRFK